MIKRSTILRGLGAATALSSISSIPRPAAAQTGKLRVAGIPIDVGAGSYYALDQGFFAKHGLDVEVTSLANGAVVAAAVAGGSLDIGDGNTVAIATAHERGIPFKLIAPSGAFNSHDPTDGVVVLDSSPYKSAKDLVGKIIGVNALRNIAEVYVRAWLDQNGVNSNQVKYVEVTFSEMGPALTTGRIDAVAPEEPMLTNLLSNGGRLIGTPGSAIAPIWVEGGFFCTTEFAAAHPDIIKKVADAIADANLWANKNPGASAAILNKYAKTPLNPKQHRCFYPPRLDARQLQPLIDATAKYGILKATFPAKDLFAPGLT
jgi:NitT/TauT family transport system substrate-binding protein